MNREQKLLHNKQVRRIGLLVATWLRNVVELPQGVIELILNDIKRALGLYPQPLRPLTLTLPPNLQQLALNPLDTVSPYRSYNRYAYDPPFRTRGPIIRRLGYGSFQ